MSNFCTLKDIHKSLGARNNALPNDLYRAREKAENHIRVMLSGKFNTSLFDSTITEIKTICVELALYFIDVDRMSRNGASASQINEDDTVTSKITIVNKQLKFLADSGDILKNVTATGASLDSNNYYRFSGRPRNVLVTNGSTTTYYVDEHYAIDYKAHTLIKINADMPSTGLTITYQIPLRTAGM